MIRAQRLTSLNQFDLEALQQLCDAEDLGLPCPDLPTDTLFRLGRLDCLTGDRDRLVKTSANGRRLLAEAPGLH